jgi:N-acyl-L-homoserine lactone synthetase
MIDCVNFETAHLFGDAIPAQFRLRHRIFVDRQRWDLSTIRGMEYDQYDTPATQYLIWRDVDGEARGIARLNPTDRPYMFKEIFSEHFEVDNAPSSPEIWEGTRFGVDRGLDANARNRIIAELLAACLEYGLSMGIKQYLVLMPLVVLKRTFPRMGCSVRIIGAEKRMGLDKVAPAICDVSQEILSNLHSKTGIRHSVLRTAHDLHMGQAA